MQEVIFIIHMLSVASLICLVLLQRGKGADMGAAFGSGASNTMFGSSGSISFFTKLTAIIALIFFITSITLGVMVAKQAKKMAASSLVAAIAEQEQKQLPKQLPQQKQQQLPPPQAQELVQQKQPQALQQLPQQKQQPQQQAAATGTARATKVTTASTTAKVRQQQQKNSNN